MTPAELRSRARSSSARTFASFANRNYRLYFAGQAVSLVGTWMQSVAQGWLVYTITDSATWVGLTIAAQMLPVLIGGPYGGLVADRADKRRLLIATQLAKGLVGLTLGLLVVTGHEQLWMVLVLAVALGVASVFDTPARQTFVPEIVGRELLGNAVSLNSILINAARAIGPAIAGLLIVTVGVGACFLIDAASYLAVIAALALMRKSELQPTTPFARAKGQVREGLRYVRRTRPLLVPLVMMALIGTFAYEFQVSLPVMARQTFGGGADAYGFMTAAVGVGAVLGGLNVARRGTYGSRQMLGAAAAFGVAILAAAAAPNLWTELIVLLAVGATSISFLATASTTLQLAAAPQMRGRVMALWSVAFLGTTPIGGPIVGLVGEHVGARWALALGGAAALAAAALGAYLLRDHVDPVEPGNTRDEPGGEPDDSPEDVLPLDTEVADNTVR